MVVDNYGYVDYQEACSLILQVMQHIENKYQTTIIQNPNTTNGMYNRTNDKIYIGTKSLHNQPINNKLNIVDLISIIKQCFHESRHLYQYKFMFTEKDSGQLDKNIIKHMAKQNCVNDLFHDYSNVRFWSISETPKYNYYHLSSEIDAECYALKQVYQFFQNKLEPSILEQSILIEIQRRNTWFINIDNMSLTHIINKLEDKLNTCTHLTLDKNTLNIPIPNCKIREYFCHNTKNIDSYFRLPINERDSYILEYANQYNSSILKLYPIIMHELPPVSLKTKIFNFGKRYNIFDENDYKQQTTQKRPMSGTIFDVYDKYIAEQEKNQDDSFDLH